MFCEDTKSTRILEFPWEIALAINMSLKKCIYINQLNVHSMWKWLSYLRKQKSEIKPFLIFFFRIGVRLCICCVKTGAICNNIIGPFKFKILPIRWLRFFHCQARKEEKPLIFLCKIRMDLRSSSEWILKSVYLTYAAVLYFFILAFYNVDCF